MVSEADREVPRSRGADRRARDVSLRFRPSSRHLHTPQLFKDTPSVPDPCVVFPLPPVTLLTQSQRMGEGEGERFHSHTVTGWDRQARGWGFQTKGDPEGALKEFRSPLRTQEDSGGISPGLLLLVPLPSPPK